MCAVKVFLMPVADTFPTLRQHWANLLWRIYRRRVVMSICWLTPWRDSVLHICDVGPTFNQHWLSTYSVGLHSCTNTRYSLASLVTTSYVSNTDSGPSFKQPLTHCSWKKLLVTPLLIHSSFQVHVINWPWNNVHLMLASVEDNGPTLKR